MILLGCVIQRRNRVQCQCETREADHGQCGGAPDQEAGHHGHGRGSSPWHEAQKIANEATYQNERRCEENRQEEPGNDIYSGAVRFLKTFSTSLFRSFICFLLVFLSYNFRHLGRQLQAWWGCFWHRKAYQNWKTSKINSCKGQSVVPKSNLVMSFFCVFGKNTEERRMNETFVEVLVNCLYTSC